jgi:hypothetical protein
MTLLSDRRHSGGDTSRMESSCYVFAGTYGILSATGTWEEIMTECGLSVERDVIGQLQFIQNLFGIAASNWDQLMLPLVVVLLFATEPV